MHFFVPFMIMAFIYIFGWRITLWLASVPLFILIATVVCMYNGVSIYD